MNKAVIWIIIILILLVGGIIIFSGGGDDVEDIPFDIPGPQGGDSVEKYADLNTDNQVFTEIDDALEFVE